MIGLANKKTVTVQPAGKDQSVLLATTKTKKQNKPAALLHKSVMKKEFRRMAKAVQNQVTLMLYYSKKLIVFLLFVFFGSYIYIWCQIQLLLLTERMLKNCSMPFCFTFCSVCWVDYLFSPSSAPSGLFWGCLHVCENFRVVAVQLQKNLMHQTVRNEWLFAVKDILSI